jgi:hypothetical protein
METLTIDINNPTAKKLLQNLADLNLITIHKNDRSEKMKKALAKLRDKSKLMPNLDEITEEVEKVRTERHAKKKA